MFTGNYFEKKMIEIGPIVIGKLRAQKGWGNKFAQNANYI